MTEYSYTFIIEPDLEDGGYVATVPILGIATQGETLEEVREMVQEAISGYIEGLIQEGQTVPVESETPSERIRLENIAVRIGATGCPH